MTNSRISRTYTTLAALLLALLIVGPVVGIPPDVSGIPVWYQDTFFYACMAMAIAGVIAVTGQLTGYFQPVRWNYVDLGTLILSVYMIIRTVVMDFIPQSAWIQIAYLAGSYAVARVLWTSMNTRRLHLFLAQLLIAGILETGYGLGQLYGFWPSHHNLFPLTGSFFNPGPYSGWLACVVPIAIYGTLQNKDSTVNTWIRYLSYAYLFLTLLVLIPATSRAAILAAVAGSLVVAWPRIKTSVLWRSMWVKYAVASVLLLALTGLYLIKKDSADGRLLIYKVTADMIAEAPVLGWGWDGFPTMYNNFQALYFENGNGNEREKYLADSVTYGFNEVLEFTAEMGILGLVLVAGIAVLLIHKWWQRTISHSIHSVHSLGFGVLASWITFALFSYPMSIPALAIVLPVTLSGINTTLYTENPQLPELMSGGKPNKTSRNALRNILSVLIVLVTSIYGIFWTIQNRPMVMNWMSANANFELQRYEVANSLYDSLFAHLRNEELFLQYAGKSYSLSRKFYQSGPVLERALFFSADPTIFTTLGRDYTLYSKVDEEKKNRAEFLLRRAKYISPYKYYPRYLLAQYFTNIGKTQKALEEAEDLLSIEPKVVSQATKQIRNEMQHIIDREIFLPEKTLSRIDNE